MYGRSAYGLSHGLNVSESEAQGIVDEYFETFPEIKRAMETTKKEIQLKGFTRNMYGRKRRFTKIKGKYYPNGAYRQGFNFKIQGGCADILRVVMISLYEYIKVNPEVKMLTTIHDEVVFEVKDNENLLKHKKNICDIMRNTVKLRIPLEVDSDIGMHYGEAK